MFALRIAIATALIAAAVVFAIGVDIREAQHQANESRQTVLALAIVAATLHFGVAALRRWQRLRWRLLCCAGAAPDFVGRGL